MLWLPLAVAFPSYRARLPNGHRVACPEEGVGCYAGSVDQGEPERVCYGLGHASCKGGSMPLNPFGEAWRASGYEWTTALCEADSDEDGFTNGEELGDPCCLWRSGDEPSGYARGFAATHPGLASMRPAGYERPACSDTAPTVRGPKLGVWSEEEGVFGLEFRIANYTIPRERTVYVDFCWNIPFPEDDGVEVYHIVGSSVIIDQPRHLHHYVLNGCSARIAAGTDGRPARPNCNEAIGGFSGWAPGAPMFNVLPSDAGVPVGPGVGIVAICLNVHFTDGDLASFKSDGAVSRDGLVLYVTKHLRPKTVESTPVMQVGFNPAMAIPPGKERYFVTRECTVRTQKPVTVVGTFYHAHLIGAEMWQEHIPKEGPAVDLGSAPIWHFDDQAYYNLATKNITLRDGDKVQSTCVWNSTTRSEETVMALETVDEMCFAVIMSLHDRADAETFACTGDFWAGELAVAEDALAIPRTHPEAEAKLKYLARRGRSGSLIGGTLPMAGSQHGAGNSPHGAWPPRAVGCDTASWEDVDAGIVCGPCRVLAANMQTHGSCEQYCLVQGLRCVGAWEEESETCEPLKEFPCAEAFAHTLPTTDALCECATPDATPDSATADHESGARAALLAALALA